MRLRQVPLLDVEQIYPGSGMIICSSQSVEDPSSMCASYDRFSYKDDHFPKAPCDRFTLALRLKGAEISRVDGSVEDGRVGRLGMSVMVPAREESLWHAKGEMESLSFFISEATMDALAQEVFNKDIARIDFQPAHFRYDRTMSHFGHAAAQRLENAETVTALEFNAWTQIVGLHILRCYSNAVGAHHQPAPSELLSKPVLSRVIDYILGRLDAGPILLSDVAAVANMPQRRFSRAFQRTTGVPLHDYVLDLKVERARNLLHSTNLSLLEIAALAGFASQSHMTSVFRRKLATTPRLFRLESGS